MPESLELDDLPNGIFSHTARRMYLRCHHQYKFRYIDGLKSPPQSALVLGSSAHDGLEGHFSQHIKEDVHPATPKLLDRFAAALPANIASQQERAGAEMQYKKGETKATLLDNGIQMLKKYDEELGKTLRPKEVEKPFRVEFSNMPWAFEGRIDMTTQDGRIVDFKTSKKRASADQADFDEQLTGYQVGVEAETPKGAKSPVKSLELHTMVRLKKGPEFQVLPAKPRSKAVLNEYLQNTAEIVQGIRAGIFPKTDNLQLTCSWCGYRALCRPEYDKHMRAKAESDDE